MQRIRASRLAALVPGYLGFLNLLIINIIEINSKIWQSSRQVTHATYCYSSTRQISRLKPYFRGPLGNESAEIYKGLTSQIYYSTRTANLSLSQEMPIIEGFA